MCSTRNADVLGNVFQYSLRKNVETEVTLGNVLPYNLPVRQKQVIKFVLRNVKSPFPFFSAAGLR
ncbi:hypothetical protein HOLleu_14697 [Holothuria leucospilota]|uniref:Uncharacterized protein n=1 Tax=Holothuria leucospilota TaxID=206669 RepID=A0A9Q1C933_HOLLE|nr:hypothetical protein HOLleu_14697 [Holothuria leucospilota]